VPPGCRRHSAKELLRPQTVYQNVKPCVWRAAPARHWALEHAPAAQVGAVAAGHRLSASHAGAPGGPGFQESWTPFVFLAMPSCPTTRTSPLNLPRDKSRGFLRGAGRATSPAWCAFFGALAFRLRRLGTRARGQLSSTGDPLSRQGAWGWGIPSRSQVHAARSMPPVAAAVSQPGMPLRHSGHPSVSSFERATTPWRLPPASDTLAATVPPDASTRRLPGGNFGEVGRTPLLAPRRCPRSQRLYSRMRN